MIYQLQKTLLLFVLFFLFTNNSCANENQKDIQIYTSPNASEKITPKSIENTFNTLGLSVVGNNDMNKPFLQRFKNTHYKIYNLAMFMNNEYSYRLIRKYPQFGALTPLTMSIWQDENKNINIATLTFHGMARAANIPDNDEDLRAYAALIHKALKKALPNGSFNKLTITNNNIADSFQINFAADVDLQQDEDLEDYVDDFEEEFEGEMESLGFLFPNITNIQDEIFKKYNYKQYDFYHTYSICKFDVIYPVSKYYPQAGAWAPCSFYIYKKKSEDKIYMGFLGVDNWIKSLSITDKTSIKALKEAEGMIQKIIHDITE